MDRPGLGARRDPLSLPKVRWALGRAPGMPRRREPLEVPHDRRRTPCRTLAARSGQPAGADRVDGHLDLATNALLWNRDLTLDVDVLREHERSSGAPLRARGFGPADVDAVMHGNWLRFLGDALPPP